MDIILEHKTKYGVCTLVYDYSDNTFCVLAKNDLISSCYAYFSAESAYKAYNEMCTIVDE